MLNIEKHLDLLPCLSVAKSIAVVGLSPKESRPSNMVARYLISAGYTVYPVNPGQNSILGLHCYSALEEIEEKIDIVNIFRRSEEVYPIVESAVEIGAKVVWMQQGIKHHEAAKFAEKNGLFVVMDRCIKVDHMNLIPSAS
jgi:predicted CoA-binding protein